MATGDILSVIVDTEGAHVDIEIEGLLVGGVLNTDLDAAEKLVPGPNTPYLTVTSPGFDANGGPTTVTRTVYLTARRRKPYPNEAQWDEDNTLGPLTIRVFLSDFIYVGDKNDGPGTSGVDITATFPAGMYTNGTPSAAVADFPVVNNSTLAYAVPIANWTRPAWERLASASVVCAAVAFHNEGRDGAPVAAIEFIATNGTQTSSAIVGSMTPTQPADRGDALTVGEYVGTIDLSSFDDVTVVTVNMKVYPLIGNNDAIYDSTPGSPTEFVNQYTAPQTWFLDTSGSRAYPICVVNKLTGSSSGYIGPVDYSMERETAAASPFDTPGRAMAALSAWLTTNALRSDIAGATIYLTDDQYGVAEDTLADGVDTMSGDCVLTFAPLPSPEGNDQATIVPSAFNIPRARFVKFRNLNFSRASDETFVDANSVATLIFENCTFTDTTATLQSAVLATDSPMVWMDRCTLNYMPGTTARWRGCYIPTGGPLGRRVMMVGNKWVKATAGVVTFTAAGSVSLDGTIFFNNIFLDSETGIFEYPGPGTGVFLQGAACVQNLMTNSTGTSARLIRVAADGNENETHNCVIAHNTVVGELCNTFYQDIPQTRKLHQGHALILNSTASLGSKSDTFAGDGRCTGNWPVRFGVNCWGNRVSGGNFPTEFRGICSHAGVGDVGDGTYLVPGYVADESSESVSPSAGDVGDYHPSQTAIIKHVPTNRQMVFWDLAGENRVSGLDAAGCYRYQRNNFVPFAPEDSRNSLTSWLLQEDFEGTGTPAGWTAASSGGTFDETINKIAGNQSLQVTGASTSTFRFALTPLIAGLPGDGSTWMAYWQMKMVSAPITSNGTIFEVRRAADNLVSQRGSIIVTTNELRLQNGSGVSGTGAYSLTAGVVYHVWIKRMADGTLQGWVNTSATFPGGAAMLNGSASVNPGAAGYLALGSGRQAVIVYDHLRVSALDIGSNPA